MSDLPTLHVAQAALHVASLLDAQGSPLQDVRESYWHHATGGTFPPGDLRMGEEVLVTSGLAERVGEGLRITPELTHLLEGTAEDAIAVIASRLLQRWSGVDIGDDAAAQAEEALHDLVPDADQRQRLLLALARRFDDSHRKRLGAIGEALVVEQARRELTMLGYEHLARQVARVSLTSDQLGYDVSAPRVTGPTRLLEVKSTSRDPAERLAVHLTRNEFETGMTYPDWALVVCHISSLEESRGEVIGWIPAKSLLQHVPKDTATGTWEVAKLAVNPAVLHVGLPNPW